MSLDVIPVTTQEAYKELYRELTNVIGTKLYPGDERLILAKTLLMSKAQEYAALNAAARQTWLDYAYGEFLDAMGARYNVYRTAAAFATCELQFYVDCGVYRSEDYIDVVDGTVVFTDVMQRPDIYNGVFLYDYAGDFVAFTGTPAYDPVLKTLVVSGIEGEKVKCVAYYTIDVDVFIPAGTTVTGDARRFFETLTDCTIEAGHRANTTPVHAQATESGADWNDIAIGEINTVVDLYDVPFAPSVQNVTVTSGGDDAQSDNAFREAIRLAPNETTTAGPQGSYEFWIREADASIIDAKAVSPQDTNEIDFPDMKEYSPNYLPGMTGTPGEVFCYAICEGNRIPVEGSDVLEKIEHVLADKRPLTDLVHVLPTHTVNYQIEVTYYATQEIDFDSVIAEYTDWQGSKFGRDINPDVLRKIAYAAGVERLDVTLPEYTKVPEHAAAHFTGEQSVTFKRIDEGEVAKYETE